MALKIRSLEHIDGKPVRYSTITSQHPEIFVQRKANTGELIISTDTNKDYAMHHIYVGGEHIAGGYGFHTAKAVQDLTYIQETYTGVYTKISDNIDYLNIGYTYIKNHVSELNIDLNDKIVKNSFRNIKVDQLNNTVKVSDNITYVLSFESSGGIIALSEQPVEYIELSHCNDGMINYYDINDNKEYFGNQYYYKTETIIKRLNVKDSSDINWQIDNINFDVTLDNFDIHTDVNNVKCDYEIIKNFNSIGVSGDYKITSMIPILYNKLIPLYASIYQKINPSEYNKTNTINFSFIKPILYGNIDADKKDNFINIFDKLDLTSKSLDNQEEFNYKLVNYISKIKTIDIQMLLNNYLIICIPKEFYGVTDVFDIGFNVSQYNNKTPYLEGGFTILGNSKDYIIYISDEYDDILDIPVNINIEFYYQ